MKKRILAGVCACACLLAGCGAWQAQSYRGDFFAMDTFMTVTVYADRTDAAQALEQEIEQRVNGLDQLLSRQRQESELSMLNAAGGAAVTVSDETYAALEQAAAFAALTDGAYDPTTAPLSDLWGIGIEAPHVPAQADIDAVLSHVGWQKIVLLPDHQVQLLDGAQVDLGGIGKGWATDAVHALCDAAANGPRVLAQLGGNILGYGKNPGRQDGMWVIGVADPDNTADPIATVLVSGESVVTSGDYERFFEENGKRYHHIFNPATGYPADSGLRSVTVVDENSTRADALTTALFVMGLDAGLAFCAEQNVKAAFVTADKQVYVTESLVPQFAFDGAHAGYSLAA